jgi:cytochrome P450
MAESGLLFGFELADVLVAAVLISVVVLYFHGEALQRRRCPPGPWPWPVVGNFSALGDLPHRNLQKLAAKYGGLMYLRLGAKPCLVISTAAVAKEFYTTVDASFASRPKRFSWTVWNNNDENYRNIGLAEYGPYYRKLRRLLNTELFSPRRHASHEVTRAQEIQCMMKVLLEESEKGNPVNLQTWLHGTTSNNMTRMVVGKRFYGVSGDDGEKQGQDLQNMTSSVFELLGSVVISDFVPYLSFITKLQGHASKFSKIRDVSDKLTANFFDLDSHRNNYKKMKNDPSYVPDFEDVLMETPFDNGTNLPDQDLLKLLQEMLNAGTETSSNTSEWAMAELIRRPELIERAQTEMDSVIGSKRLVEESDIQQLPFLQALMKENFRLHPPAPLLLPHESREPTELLGYHFPAGTELLVNAFAIHRDPSVYDNPDNFDPDRFLARPHVDHMSTSDPYELMPFGKGLRMCPGYRLANTMVALMLANLLYVFDWSLPEGQTAVDMTETISLSVSKKQPLFLVPKPRFELSL